MLIVHAAFEASVAPHVEADSAKSAALVPLISVDAAEVMATAALSLLVTVTVLAALGEPIP
jgi:hypothetical protein